MKVREGRATTRWREEVWIASLVVGVVLSALGALTAGPMLNGLLQQGLGWISVAVGVTIARKSKGMVRRTWWCFALASSSFLVGGLIRTVHGAMIGAERPFPSPPAEIILIVGHTFLITGSILLGHLRSPDRNRAAIIDGALVAAAVETVMWVLLLWPYVTNESIPIAARVVNTVYALLTTVLLASTARLAVGPGARTTSYRLLAVAIILIFVQDLAVTVEAAGGPEARLGRALAPFIFVFFSAAALHPHLSRVTEAADTINVKLTWQRVSLLVGALLTNPVMLGVSELLGRQPAVAVHIVSSVVISVLVLARLGSLMRSQERATRFEHELRRANAQLAVAPTTAEMHRATVESVIDLVDERAGLRASMLVATGSDLVVLDSAGSGPGPRAGSRLPLAETSWWPLTSNDAIEIVEGPDERYRRSRCSYIVPLGAATADRHVLVITSATPIPLVQRETIRSLAATAGLALETAALTAALARAPVERRFQALVENSSDLIVVIDADHVVTFVSPASRRLLGRDEEDLIGVAARDLSIDDDVTLLDELLDRAEGRDFSLPVEVRLRHGDGSHRWFEVATRDLTDQPEIEAFVLNCREVSDRKDAELRLHRSEARFRALVQNVGDVVAVIDDWGRFTYVSPAITPLLGYRAEQLLDTPATAIIASDRRDEAQEVLLQALREIADRSNGSSIELRALALDGTARILDVTVSDLRHDPAVQGIVLNARDITERKQLESTLRHQAHHDALTGLANRTLFADMVDACVTEHVIGACVLFIDLDDFKTVNDSLGHAFGDQLLVAVARRLTRSLPFGATAARLGGDEFAVLVRPTDDDLGPVGVALRLLHDLRAPFDIDGWEIVVTASIGIAAIGDEPTTAEVVLRNADMAMYLAKERGKDRVELFEEAMHVTAFERLELKADLARAITSGQLTLVYQPVVSLETGRITGAEALVRWDHPRRGRLGPDAFIGIAEETGLIVQLGQWVLEEACQQLRTWQLTLPNDAALSMSVNLSVRQLEQPSIVDSVRQVLDQFALNPKTLTLEITETVVIDHMEDDRSRITALKELGVNIALDDFGTGYSSLRYADDLPVDVIKVDRSFVAGITGTEPTPVLEAIVALGSRLGVHTVAEGIETPAQIVALKAIGCDLGQGYWFSRPVEAREFAELLTRNLSHGGFDTSGPVEDRSRQER